MDSVTIRMAVAEDFKTIYRFINLLEDDVFDQTTQHLLFAENIANPNVIYLLAFADEKSVGLLSCHIQNLLHHAGKVGEIQEMYVVESARSLGVGKRLIEALKVIATERNLVQLEVTSSFKRADAHRFYERENFIFTHKKFTYPLK